MGLGSMTSNVMEEIGRIVGEETENSGLRLARETVADEVAGWDSVAHSRIMLRVEEFFGIRIDYDRMYSFSDVGQLVDYVTERTLGIDAAVSAPEPVSVPKDGQPSLEGSNGPISLVQDDVEVGIVEEAAPSAGRDPIFNLFSVARFPAPYSMFHDKPGSIPGRAPDCFGFNNVQAPEIPKPSGEVRVFVFGNSTIRGGDIVESMQSEYIAQGRPDVKVYNFGMISAVSYQALMYFVWQGVDLEPDLIVTFDGYSDIGGQAVGYDPRPGYPYNQHMLEIIHEAMGSGRIQDLKFTSEERKRRDFLRAQVGWKTARWREQLANSYLNSIQKFHEIARAYGTPIYSCLQPTLAWKKTFAEREAIKASSDLVFHVRETYSIAQEGFRELQDAMNPTQNRFGDFSLMFAERDDVCFTDMVHLTKECYREIGERLSQETLDMLKKRRAA